jgi:hypothetical protein
LGAEGHTTATEPAFLWIPLNGRFALYRVRYQGITHTDIHTDVAPRTNLLIKVDVSKAHEFFSFP